MRPVCKYHEIVEKRERNSFLCCINARDRLSRHPTLSLSRHCHVSRAITRDILIDSHYTVTCIWLRNSLSSLSLTRISLGRARVSQQTIIYLCNTSLLPRLCLLHRLQTSDRLQPTLPAPAKPADSPGQAGSAVYFIILCFCFFPHFPVPNSLLQELQWLHLVVPSNKDTFELPIQC